MCVIASKTTDRIAIPIASRFYWMQYRAFQADLGRKNSRDEMCAARRKVLSILISCRLMCLVQNVFNLVSVFSLTKMGL